MTTGQSDKGRSDVEEGYNSVAVEDEDDDTVMMTEDTLVGTETFLLGLAPSFWAHVPMFIGQLVNDVILLENGVQCLPVNNSSTAGSNGNGCRWIPVTKCQLVGHVIAAERKGGACVQYVLDDGTGLIDCLYWDNNDEGGGALPALTLEGAAAAQQEAVFPIGELVKVHGKIQCCAATPTAVNTAAHATTSSIGNTTLQQQQNIVVREIHASLVQSLSSSRPRSQHHISHSLDPEWQHWRDCMRLQQQQQKECTSITNAMDVLQLLGPHIRQQVADRTQLPSADDTVGAWRLFGTQCPCITQIGGAGSGGPCLKRDLLYCHCIATVEPMDPNYVYRDNLLWELLDLEHHNYYQAEQKLYLAEDEELQLEERRYHPLRFSYQSLREDQELNRIAKQVILSLNLDPAATATTTATTKLSVNIAIQQQMEQLVRNTVRALRQDGILYLVDPTKDIYMLISKGNVLRPYIQQSLHCRDHVERERFHSQRPDYLQNVPRARLQLVKRMVLEEQQQQKQQQQSNSPLGDDDDSDMGDSDRVLLPQTQWI